ncbi:MAG: hypothetical protein V4591_07400 [Bdellovibrionota bacterium]
MQIKYLAIKLVIIYYSICFFNVFALPVLNYSNGSMSFISKDSKGYLKIKIKNAYSLLYLDNGLDNNYVPDGISLIGEIKDVALIFIDSYPSRTVSKSGYCGAGNEVFLRVISIKEKIPKEAYKIKIASCFDSIELQNENSSDAQLLSIGAFDYSKNSIIFNKNNNKISINWGYNPKKENTSTTILSVDRDCKVTREDK